MPKNKRRSVDKDEERLLRKRRKIEKELVKISLNKRKKPADYSSILPIGNTYESYSYESSPNLKLPEEKLPENVIQVEAEINPHYLELLGKEPANEDDDYGQEIIPNLASRWSNYISQSIEKETKAELLSKYKIPKNVELLKGPELNPEISSCLSESNKKKDKFCEKLQNEIAKAPVQTIQEEASGRTSISEKGTKRTKEGTRISTKSSTEIVAEQFTILWVLFSMIVLGNSAVLIALLLNKSRKSRMNFFIKHLALAGKRARLLVILAWALSVIFALPAVYLFEERFIDGVPQCWIDLKDWQWKVYMTLVSFVLFLVPALVISACYAVIVWTIWSKSKILIPVGHGPIRHMFVLCWSPYIVFDLLQVYGYIPKTQTNIAIATLIQSLAPLNSAANPVIYCLFSTHVCRNLRKLPPFRWMSRCAALCFSGTRGPRSHCLGYGPGGGSGTVTTTTTTTHSSRRSGSAQSLRHTIRLQPALHNSHKVAISVV
ncbi:unnamed protein product [Brassicogethes aeneus]|uniref:G-protein coupled receptors family 1 profile domain-containing protein n=1 Tax=Brassicogethes aeneus TaxID=1431903 RepID=A0A9P0FIT7_BRAAE|nr:unnamed protein product [Brassicogethes aeneus]